MTYHTGPKGQERRHTDSGLHNCQNGMAYRTGPTGKIGAAKSRISNSRAQITENQKMLLLASLACTPLNIASPNFGVQLVIRMICAEKQCHKCISDC